MRSLGIRLPILAVTAWAGIGLSVWASSYRYGERVYVTPTTTTVVVPTSYSSFATYGESASYSFPSYLPTSYAYEPAPLASTSYLASAYVVRRGLFGRLRVVERPVLASYATRYTPTLYFSPGVYASSYRATSYVPTVYSPRVYANTVYADSSTVWESSYASPGSSDCDQVAWNAPAVSVPSQSYSNSAPSYPAPAQNYQISPNSDGSSKTAQSDTVLDPVIPSNVPPAPAEEPPLISGSTEEANKRIAAPAGSASSPPVVPTVPRQQSTAQPAAGGAAETGAARPKTGAKPANNQNPTPPSAPGADPTEPELKPAPIDNSGTSRRDSLRPSFASRTSRSEVRNVLMGRVETDGGDPLSEVPVSATSRDGRSIRRADMTDAFGNFAIRLDDGEWTVNVQKPSGRVFAVRTVTVSNGKVVDNQERREVRNLIISY
jgi:hypothetical protein